MTNAFNDLLALDVAALPRMSRHRWTTSSKRNPCPLCGRDSDDKCRRSADLISCYWGERFSPPAGLKLGQVLTVEGGPWAVVNLSGGFAGNSLILRPDSERKAFRPAEIQQQKRAAVVLAPVLRSLFIRLRSHVHACLAIAEFQHATAEQLCADRELLAATVHQLQQLRGPLVLARREDPAMGRLVQAVDHWLKLISYQARDLAAFDRWAL
ncbi:hypothetical protein KQ313_01715 [Synechococcus sp. CS-1325]|uniref:hypothetical protein n=1 Tax=Synechococcus sp. CS-1325 TaxID=2847979 RepID=UPI000DAF7B4B|nr:hypothetical protein [Synechococcus sp. CS-1325]MCT0198405.1 hypothetical protein [Synechococcus sp. CS-1325]PZU98093.1 MAG: hypothetical protein DCF24_11470 [Cyanobium sp.]